MSRDIVTRTSEDGHDYQARTVPTEVNLQVLDYVEHDFLENEGAFRSHHFYVTGKEIKNKKLPLWEVNPREPSRTGPVRSMEKTLTNSPQDFVKKNNGMTLLCDDVTFSNNEHGRIKGEVELKFGEDEGICNGGHTYFALVCQAPDFVLDKAIVRLEAIEIGHITNEEEKSDIIIDISSARNAHKQLQDISITDQLGYFDIFKNNMDVKMVSWREGDHEVYDQAIKADRFIGFLESIDPSSCEHGYYNPGGSSHQDAVTRPGSVFSSWLNKTEQLPDSEDPPLSHLTPVINDLFFIRDMISFSLKNYKMAGEIGGNRVEIKSRNFYQDYILNRNGNLPIRQLRYGRFNGESGAKLNSTLDVLMTGLFRTNMWCSKKGDVPESDYLGWFVEIDGLWKEQYLDILAKLSGDFTASDSDKKDFVRDKSPYQRYVYTIGTYQQERPPEILRDYENNKYILTQDKDLATHGMELDGSNWDDPDREIELNPISSTTDPYAIYMEYNKLTLVNEPGNATHAIPPDMALVPIETSWEGTPRYYDVV